MKKKALMVGVLAIVFALSLVAIASAKYAGYAYNNPMRLDDGAGGTKSVANPLPGYLSWSGAKEIVQNYTDGTPDMATAHGGYVTGTTKCAVCHSAHRAFSAKPSASGTAPTNLALTAGGNGCLNCHSTFGAGGASKKVEWANVLKDPADSAGPHSSFGCTAGAGRNGCHTGGIHGTDQSQYHGMNAYMLGGQKDTDITTAFEAGNVGRNITYTSGAKPESGGVGAQWFQTGSSEVPASGTMPENVTGLQFAAAKGMATGYTCAQGGCHTASQFAVNTWGFSESHESVPGSTTAPTLAFTGHATGAMTQEIIANETGGCGPCHPGNGAGGYRTTPVMNNQSAAQYGCDQCHDMVGKATNTTAWPHGNRNITVLEWDKRTPPVAIDKKLASDSGNLWMYQANIAAKYHKPAYWEGTPVGEAGTEAMDPSFKVIEGATSWSKDTGVGNINDGACLKCHVAIDSKTLSAEGVRAGDPVYVATGGNHSHVYDEKTSPAAKSIFLWK